MDLLAAIGIGAWQGILEWLPISSQGNLMIFMVGFLGLTLEEALSLSIWVHVGIPGLRNLRRAIQHQKILKHRQQKFTKQGKPSPFAVPGDGLWRKLIWYELVIYQKNLFSTLLPRVYSWFSIRPELCWHLPGGIPGCMVLVGFLKLGRETQVRLSW